MAEDQTELFDRVKQVYLALGDVTTREKLDVLLFTWECVAANARNEQLQIPNGFTDEQARQLTKVNHVAERIQAAAPDYEGERLHQSGDEEGWRRHVERQLRGRGSH